MFEYTISSDANSNYPGMVTFNHDSILNTVNLTVYYPADGIGFISTITFNGGLGSYSNKNIIVDLIVGLDGNLTSPSEISDLTYLVGDDA